MSVALMPVDATFEEEKEDKPRAIRTKTDASSTSSKAPGRRLKYAALRIDPAEKATRANRILCNVLSFGDKANIPTNEKR